MGLKTIYISILLLVALLLSTVYVYATVIPQGLSTISSSSALLAIPPGASVYIKVDPNTGTIIIPNQSQLRLPSIAYDALQHVPAWIRRLLERQFYLLLQEDMRVPGRSYPSICDLNHDGLPDIVVGSKGGIIYVYIDVGKRYDPIYKLLTTINVTKDLGVNETLDYVGVAAGDIDGDGLPDIVVGLPNGTLVLYRNTGTETQPSWTLDTSYFKGVRVGGYAAPAIYDVNGDGKKDIIVGSKEGIIYCYLNEGTPGNPKWVYNSQYFPAWLENWYDGRGWHYEGVWVGNYSVPYLFTHAGTLYLIVGDWNGTLYLFRNTGYSSDGYPSWEKIGPLPNLGVSSYSAPAIGDLNSDGQEDLVLGSGDGHLYLVENFGSPIYPYFKTWPSGAENYLLAKWFWGPAYYPLMDTIPVLGTDYKYVDLYAKLILNTTAPYIDEVAYAIAVDRPANLKMLADRNGSWLYVLNAKSIYEMAKKLPYVQIVDTKDYSTLKYKTENGWKLVPPEIYYKYLVTFNRYILAPWGWPTRYNGKFFRTFLPFDNRYNVTLYQMVENATTMYQAAYRIDYWLRAVIKAWWHMGPKWKPWGWYNIYLHLTDKQYAILCGEFSIIYEAAARAVLIPTVVVVDIAEDHQFNNFWYNGTWHHVDASSGSSGPNGTWREYFDPPRGLAGWYKNKGFSWVMEWEEDGMYDCPWRSPIPYAPEGMLANLTFHVVDENGKPIDGARVEVWSHWTIEHHYDTAPYIAGFVFTDKNGYALFPMLGLGRTHNFTVIVTSRIGSTMFEIHLTHGGVYNYTVVIPGKLPEFAGPSKIISPGTSKKYIEVAVGVLHGEQHPPDWIDILYRYFGYRYYIEFYKGVWINAYIVDENGLKKYMENTFFPAYYAAIKTKEFDTGFFPINGTVYIILSNRQSLTTTVYVYVSISLLEDKEAPSVKILSPATGSYVNSSTVTIKYKSTAEDTAYYLVSVDGETPVKVTETSYTVKGLADGKHVITVRAVDISGNIGDPATVTITVDTKPPVIELENVADGTLVTSPTLTISGKAVDAVKLWVNGEQIELGSDGSFTTTVNLQTGMNKIVFKAVDEAGNTIVKDIRVYYYPELATKQNLEKLANLILSSLSQETQKILSSNQEILSEISKANTMLSSIKTTLTSLQDTINSKASSLESLINSVANKITYNIQTSSNGIVENITSKINGLTPTLYADLIILLIVLGLAAASTYGIFKKK